MQSHPSRTLLPRVLAVLSMGLPIVAGAGADWPHWLGAGRNGLSAEHSRFRAAPWPAARPTWRTTVGEGASSPLAAGGRVYTIGWANNRDTVTCLDAATGAVVWQQHYPAPRYGRHATGDQGFYGGATATPELDLRSGYLYTLSADGDLHCWDTRAGGRRVWGFNLTQRYGVRQRTQVTRRAASLRDYGYTAAPLLLGNALLVEAGAPDGHVMAFDPRTGDRLWASASREQAGHAGGMAPITISGQQCIAVLGLRKLIVMAVESDGAAPPGRTVAEYSWEVDYGNCIPTPAVEGQHVLLTSAHNLRRMVKLHIAPGAAQPVWEQNVYSAVCTPVIHRGSVYWASQGLQCADLATGKLRWEGGRFGQASSCLVTADGRVVVWSNEGDLALVEGAERSPGEYRELSLLPRLFHSEAWPQVVLAEGRLFCRARDGNLACFALPPAP